MPRFTPSLGRLSLAFALAGSVMLCSSAHAAPGKPAGLQASPVDENNIMLSFEDTADNEALFEVFGALHNGTLISLGTIPANSTQALVSGLSPGILYDFRVRAVAAGGAASALSNLAAAYTDKSVTPTLNCSPGNGVCLDNRFRVSGTWRTSTDSGTAVPHPISNLSTAFYFFAPDNLEVLLKVLDGCGLNERFWVFFSATTNVEVTMSVTDTQEGTERQYFNPLNRPYPPVQDTSAFATCP
jgi:hypothetical protein